MTKIGIMRSKGHPDLVTYYDDSAKVNPFRVCMEWVGETGRKHRRQVARYADLSSCGEAVLRYTRVYNHE